MQISKVALYLRALIFVWLVARPVVSLPTHLYYATSVLPTCDLDVHRTSADPASFAMRDLIKSVNESLFYPAKNISLYHFANVPIEANTQNRLRQQSFGNPSMPIMLVRITEWTGQTFPLFFVVTEHSPLWVYLAAMNLGLSNQNLSWDACCKILPAGSAGCPAPAAPPPPPPVFFE